MKTLVLLLLTAGAGLAQVQEISGARMRADVKFLASDLLEGRGVGTRGEALTTEYLAAQFAIAGLKPAGDDGTYFQRVPLTGVKPEASSTLSASAKGKTESFQWLREFVGVSHRQQPQVDFEGEAVFVGHGITAPEFQWDDFKGVDVRGKVLVMFTNEPDSTDPNFFGGPALTYYGRWTYKFEQALRKGAVAAVIIHTTPTAGYGWEVVRNSWGNEDPQVKLAPGSEALALAGWVTREAGNGLLALGGRNVDELLKLAGSRNFRPIPLGIRLRGSMPSKIRSIESRNVAGIISGSDPKLASEAVIFSAHWDHLGIGTPVASDGIYNGAVDNATGCAILLEIARTWSALPRKPARSALFLAVTAEESGLRGSEFYGRNPVVPVAKTAVNLNFDAFYPFGRTRDVVLTGAERTTMWPLVQDIAKRFNLEIKSDPRPEQGLYFRSDHFSLAKAGIPAFSIKQGNEFQGKAAGFGEQVFKEFNTKHYHQPSDEYREDWDFAGLEEIARFGFVLGTNAANLQTLPQWKPGDEFRKAFSN